MPTEAGARRRTWLVAPDAFKGTFTAAEVTRELVDGLREAGRDADPCPLADGGEGTTAVLLAARGGELLSAPSHDPLGREIEAELGLLGDGEVAVVETAAASGLALLDPGERDAEAASSAGTGELIVAARDAGATRIMLAVGGSATTDGGAGAIEAIERAGGLGAASLEVLCDTTVSFERAASVFGPQKGADPATVEVLGRRLAEQAAGLPRDPTSVPMTGAAGGLAGGLWASYGARLRSGADAVLDAVGFDARAAAAGQVVTGEGRLDSQSAEGKLVGRVAARAGARGACVHAVVGQLALDADELARLGLASAIEAGDPSALRAAGRGLGTGDG